MTDSSLVRYQGFSLEALADNAAQVSSLSGVYMQLEVGENVVRFLPDLHKPSPFRVTAMHYVDLPGDKKAVFACPRFELKRPCACCQENERLSRGDKAQKDMAYKMRAGLRVYANVINRARPEMGPRILSLGTMLWNQLKEIRKSVHTGGDFTLPGPDGMDIVIRREGTGMLTRYTTSAARDNSPLAGTPEEIEEILAMQHNLDAQIDPTIPEELLAMWGQPVGYAAARTTVHTLPPAVAARHAAAQTEARVGASFMAARLDGGAGLRAPQATALSNAAAAIDDEDDFA